VFDAKAISSSIAWENTRLADVTLRKLTFVNVSLRGAKWRNVTIEDCQLGDLALDSTTRFSDVIIRRCQVDSVRVEDGEDDIREFAPARIKAALERVGMIFAEEAPLLPLESDAEGTFIRAARTLLSVFRRSTVVRESQVRHRLRGDAAWIADELLAIASDHGVLTEKTWKGSGQDRIWSLTARLDDVLAAEGGSAREDLTQFWEELRRRG
jgi:hypothetical protein